VARPPHAFNAPRGQSAVERNGDASAPMRGSQRRRFAPRNDAERQVVKDKA
jgi:hypothetical protein